MKTPVVSHKKMRVEIFPPSFFLFCFEELRLLLYQLLVIEVVNLHALRTSSMVLTAVSRALSVPRRNML